MKIDLHGKTHPESLELIEEYMLLNSVKGSVSLHVMTGNSPVMQKKIIDQIAENVLYINYYFQGEPFINPHFLSFVKYAKSKGVFCATSTNAHFLNSEKAKETVASGLDKMIISIDGTTQETYEKYRKN